MRVTSALECVTNEQGEIPIWSAFRSTNAWHACALSLLLTCSAGAACAGDLLASAQALEDCFRKEVAAHNVRSPARRVPLDASTSIFFAEHYVGQWSTSAAAVVVKDLECKPLAALYIDRALVAVEQRRRESGQALALLGASLVVSESPVVQTYQKLIGRHLRGHGEISAAAVRTRIDLSTQAKVLFAAASQGPDLYRWNDDRYHAQTPSYDSATDKVTRQNEGISKYVALLRNLILQAKLRADGGDTVGAIVLAGFAGHLAQDLVYHRGMTLRQHAGLSYYADRNPDQPPEDLSDARFKEAEEMTSWLLDQIMARLEPASRVRLASWLPAGDFSTEGAIRTAFALQGGGSREDISTEALLRYWLLSRDYSQGRLPATDLEQRPCHEPIGLACWSVPEVRARLEKSLSTND